MGDRTESWRSLPLAAVERRRLLPPSASRRPPASYHPITMSAANNQPVTHPEPIAEAARSPLHPVPNKFELFELFELFDLGAKEGSRGCESNHLQSRSTARAAGFWTPPAHGAYV